MTAAAATTTTNSSDGDFEVAYLGPEGTFSHLVAQRRYPGHPLRPFRTVPEVFDFVVDHHGDKGIVPIENSSGGMIIPTVDEIIAHALSLSIEEELSLDVKLALVGRKGETVTTIFSHLAPICHCEAFLKEFYPQARTVPCPSTSAAAELAAQTPGGAVIGPIVHGELHGLDVLVYPIQEEVPNVTQFFVVTHARGEAQASAAAVSANAATAAGANAEKTSIVMALPNEPGSLFKFLKPFNDSEVNLTRIESRPILGKPNTYKFLVEVAGTEKDAKVCEALRGAQAVSTQFHKVGAYPVMPRFQS